ncbi:MAG: hypothetical protein WB952_09435 [Terriglobales bacterium]
MERTEVYQGEFTISKVEAGRKALLVLPEAAANRFMRYENHLLTKLNNAENSLERKQRLRRGEEVPPPPARIT